MPTIEELNEELKRKREKRAVTLGVKGGRGADKSRPGFKQHKLNKSLDPTPLPTPDTELVPRGLRTSSTPGVDPADQLKTQDAEQVPRGIRTQGGLQTRVTPSVKRPGTTDVTIGGPEYGSLTVHKGVPRDRKPRGVPKGGRGATFAERGKRRGRFVRPGERADGKIAPPKSIGDMIRYKREVKEQERERDFQNKSRVTDIAAEKSALASRQQKSQDIKDIGEQERRAVIDQLSTEYSDPGTTPDRKLEIEREIAVRRGSQPTRPTTKSTVLTDKQKADLGIQYEEEYQEERKDPLFGKPETKYEYLKRTYGEEVAKEYASPDTSSDVQPETKYTEQQRTAIEGLLRKNPEKLPEFIARYGYKPEGF